MISIHNDDSQIEKIDYEKRTWNGIQMIKGKHTNMAVTTVFRSCLAIIVNIKNLLLYG